MSTSMSRRSALGLGAVAAAAGAAVSSPAQAAPAGKNAIRRVYAREKAEAGGVWHTHIAAVGADGTPRAIVEDDADHVTYGYSVQKLAVATAVMDKIDRGLLTLGTKLDLPADIILGGSGIYHLHRVWGDEITVGNFLTAMLLVSDNTAVRMCGRVVPALEINEILAAKGFVHTRVEPVANPNRFFLGTTTPREMHDLLWRLATKTLLKPESCDFLLSVTRWVNGYHDGVRRVMSSKERERVATKYGADFNALGESRHEAGVMFSADGLPLLTYAMFAEGLGDPENYGATHPAVEAHARIGRTLFDNLPAVSAVVPRTLPKRFHPNHGG
ncbi:serine hydrolase [Actinoplanes sp. OR16]|uniref:serine hydrolase n=1 Tax=Actinoplanes sp. OR16 TaxID=946334 RepID=UPI000F6CBD84|nr:serine hydrolase [Actinoplanes sp. OR16]BBH70061.1 serine hydrolase [Actinoplanes sp. OR16]